MPEPPSPPALGPGDFARVFGALPTPYLVLSPELVIVGANPAYLAVSRRGFEEMVGRPVFEVFPPSADALDPSGVSRVQRSFERARDTGRPDTMPLEKYDIHDPDTGGLIERFWSLISVPVLDDDGRTVLLLQRTEDVTDFVRERERGSQRVADAEADVYARAKELAAARATEALATQRLAALADVALRLAQAETVQDLAAVVVERGLAALGADGGAIAVRGSDDALHLAITPSLGERAQLEYSTLPLDSPLPGSASARTGERILLPDEQASRDHAPEMDDVLAQTGCVAWACLPLRTPDRLLGSLSVGWRTAHPFPPDELEVLDALAAQCAYGLDRIQARQAERAAARAAHRMSSALQRALLTEPPQPDDLSLVVRYRPAAHEAQVGGDWYDAFVTAAGTTTVVIGDVAGHDRDAAAVMGQLRNVLRGVAYVVAEPPGVILSRLDQALHGLEVGSLATAVLASVHEGCPAAPGTRRLQWSNAGHPPPLLVEPDGSVRLLRTEPDLLLGLDPQTTRGDHEVALQPGATLLLYTDGLVERRGQSLDDGLAWLQRTVAAIGTADLDRLCDALLDEVGGGGEDDVALLALYAGPR